ncbi:MAG: sensor histidine kinase [Ruminiclostridium sp.]|nr:sensor histidine kinase [Ruminiclostridium sp.]
MRGFFVRTASYIRNLPIKRKLVFSFLILIVVPALIIGLLSLHWSSTLLKRKTGQYARDILLETNKNIQVKLQEAELLSFQVVSNTDIHDALRMTNHGFLSEYEKVYYERIINTQIRELISSLPGIAAIQVISNTNASYYINPASLSLETMHLGEEEKRVLQQAEGSVCWFDTDPASCTTAMGRVINSHINLQKIGYVVIYLRESFIFNTFGEAEFFGNGELLLINEWGSIISCRDKAMLGSQNSFTAAEIINNATADDFNTFKINENNYYVTYRTVEGTSWRLFSYIPTMEYDKDIHWIRNWIWLIILAACLLSVAVSIAISNGISRPVRELSQKMLKIGDGDFSVSSTYVSKDEIGTLSLHFNKMVEQVKQLIRKVYQEELLKQKAELKSLRMQINPHFLYNSLESINWMARIRGVPEIGKMVKALGDLMRGSIGGEDFVTVEEEIRNIDNYLTIQKFRYGEKVKVDFMIDPAILPIKIPKLILQPIVENAIVHGIEGKVGNGGIVITGKNLTGKIELRVEDDGVGMEEDLVAVILTNNDEFKPEGHTHIGLKNVVRRIRMYYGDETPFTITSKPGEGTAVTICIPKQGYIQF